MRILFLSNFYPPSAPGGYGQWCYEVATRLEQRGHSTAVLTSTHDADKIKAKENGVYRLLHMESNMFYYEPIQFFVGRRQREKENLLHLHQIVEGFQPDVLFVWGMWNLSRGIPAEAEKLGTFRVVYYISGDWPSLPDPHTLYWRMPTRRWFMQPVKKLLGRVALTLLAREGRPVPLRFDHAIIVSHATKDDLIQAGVPLQRARVIHGGIDVERFICYDEPEYVRPKQKGLSLLYAGRLVPDKGAHTAIEGLAKLVHERGVENVRLTVVGSGPPNYEAYLRDLVAHKDVSDYVTFLGHMPPEEMPKLLPQFDVLVFPSTYQEPLARMTQEAMASGLVVVGTTTGGTKEILVDGENGLTFAPEDAEGLADQIERLVADPALRRRLAEAGRKTVMERFSLDRMVGEIEAYLQQVVKGSCP